MDWLLLFGVLIAANVIYGFLTAMIGDLWGERAQERLAGMAFSVALALYLSRVVLS